MIKKILAIGVIMLILLATFASIWITRPAVAITASGIFTGNIYDYGLDTDADGLCNFLVVEVEVDVAVAGLFTVEVSALRDFYGYLLWFYSSDTAYLDVGVQNVTLSFSGLKIYANKFNPNNIYGVYLYNEYPQLLDSRNSIVLHETYTYAEFDNGAVLTGTLYDAGVDTDSDGLYNYLKVGVEINVSDEAFYQVYVSGLINTSYYYIYDVYNYTEEYLSPGIQVLNASLHGAPIYASHATNISMVNTVYLYVSEGYGYYQLEYRNDLNLTSLYNYSEFESPAYFTGTVYDRGVNIDLDPKYDYLEISVEVNFTEAGNYNIEIPSLVNDASQYLYIYQCVSRHFDVGVQLVNLTVYGTYLYVQHFNPRYIGLMKISPWEPGLVLDKLSNVPLPTPYNYMDFESHALLTGKTSDRGVDADGDGLFDYLEVGIEINVTEAGKYEVYVGDLLEQVGGSTRYLYYPQSIEDYFDVDNHTVYLNYEGSRFVYERFSPTNISSIGLYERTYPYVQLGYIPSAPLSKKYNYTLFDPPLKDMQVNFIVYPNGTMGIDGTFNFTHMYPQNMGPQMNTTLSISTTDETTRGSVNGTFVFPKDGMFRWPFDSTTANFASQYNNGLLNTTLDVTLFMPPEERTTYPFNASAFSFNSTYSNGLVNAELWGETEIPLYYSSMLFPLNITDFTVRTDYIGNEIKGNITFHALPGFTLGDVIVYFNGNKTDLYLTGYVNVTYGSFFDMEINSTILEEMLAEFNNTIPGRGSQSLYNMTWGSLECTQLNTTKTEWSNGLKGADVEYNVTIHGNSTGFFARLLTQYNLYNPEEQYPSAYAALESVLSTANASLILNYYHTSGIATLDLHLASDVKALWTKALELVLPALPPTMPPDSKTLIEAMLKMANATACAIQGFSFNASYSSTAQKLDLHAWLLENSTQLEDDIIQILPDIYPPPLREIVKSYINTTYCTLTSSNSTFTYTNGTGNFDMKWVLQGDLKAQISHTKRFYIDYLNATAPRMFSWQLSVLNETEIDIGNFSAEFKIGKDWMYATFNGVIIQPPKDEIDFIRFRLLRFFNTTGEDKQEPPRQFEKLKITITAGFNGTHTILLYAPGTVHTPDITSLDYKTMTWQNTTLSSLKDLTFRIAYQGVIDYLGKTYYVPVFTNSTVSNFKFTPSAKSMSFNVTGTSGTGFSEITIPRALLYAAIGEWAIKIDGVPLTSENFTVTENAEYVFINLNYSHSEHIIEIAGTWIITEFQPNILLLILAMLSLIATVIAVKHRKKLGTITTRYQSTIRAFTSKIHQLRT